MVVIKQPTDVQMLRCFLCPTLVILLILKPFSGLSFFQQINDSAAVNPTELYRQCLFDPGCKPMGSCLCYQQFYHYRRQYHIRHLRKKKHAIRLKKTHGFITGTQIKSLSDNICFHFPWP